MKCDLRDARTLVITPESIAEQELLLRFDGQMVKIEEPTLLAQYIKPLVVEAKPTP